MGFFAILGESDNAEFRVPTCHVNLWVLGGLFRRHVFFCDVGLRIAPNGNDPVTNVAIALPFGSTPADLIDLKNKMTSQQTLELVFGEEVKLSQDSMDYGEGQVKPIGIERSECNLDDKKSDESFSLWNLKLSPAIKAGEEGYLRVRFYVRTVGRLWTRRRTGLFSKGALIDVRVSDVRETWNVKDGPALKTRIVPLSNLYVFLILPSGLKHQFSSPAFRHVRILEGAAWEAYLASATNFWKQRKMLVYYWKSAEEVTTKKPFRAFLDAAYSNSSRDYILLSIVLFLTLWIVYSVALYLNPRAATINSNILHTVSDYAIQIILGVVGLGLLKLLGGIAVIRSAVDWLKTKSHDIDPWILRHRAR